MNSNPVFLSYEQLNELFNGRESLITSNDKEGVSELRLPSFKDSSFGVFRDGNTFNQSLMISQHSDANNTS